MKVILFLKSKFTVCNLGLRTVMYLTCVNKIMAHYRVVFGCKNLLHILQAYLLILLLLLHPKSTLIPMQNWTCLYTPIPGFIRTFFWYPNPWFIRVRLDLSEIFVKVWVKLAIFVHEICTNYDSVTFVINVKNFSMGYFHTKVDFTHPQTIQNKVCCL